MRIALLHSRIRVEERLLVEALESRSIEHELIDVRALVFDIHDPNTWRRFDAVLERCMSQTQALAAVRVFESFDIPCINSSTVIDACGDKLTTSLLLAKNRVPTPRTRIALEPEAAIRAIEQNGYPAVLKPTVGSWGRLLARVNDRDAAEAIVEHKATLGSVSHSVFYVQEYVKKPERDLRVFVIGGVAICGIVRASAHWITNTARGGQATVLEITPQIADLCARAAEAIGGSNSVLAIDLLECPDRGLLVSEINHTMEFRNSIAPTGVDIPGRIIDHVLRVASVSSPRTVVETKPSSPSATVRASAAKGAA